MPPIQPNDDQPIQPLPEDGQTPFTPADPGRNDASEPDDVSQSAQLADDTHPNTDNQLDTQEAYDEGIGGAAEMDEPNAGNSVIGYTQPNDAEEE